MSPQWLDSVRLDLPNSGTSDSCEKDCALGIGAKFVDSSMSLWRRHLSVQALKADIIGIQCMTDEVKHLGPVRENDAEMRSATTRKDATRIDHLLIGGFVESSLYDCRFLMSAATLEEGL